MGRLIPGYGFVSVNLGHHVQACCFEHQDSPQKWLTNSEFVFFFPQAELRKGKYLENELGGQIDLTSNSDPTGPNYVTLGLSFLICKTCSFQQ